MVRALYNTRSKHVHNPAVLVAGTVCRGRPPPLERDLAAEHERAPRGLSPVCVELLLSSLAA